jgi:hypothetical protein
MASTQREVPRRRLECAPARFGGACVVNSWLARVIHDYVSHFGMVIIQSITHVGDVCPAPRLHPVPVGVQFAVDQGNSIDPNG